MRAAALVLVAAVVGAGCGDDGESTQRRDPFMALEQEFATKSNGARAAPRWERVRVLEGDGPAEEAITVARDAIQWRVRWRCASGGFALAVTPRPAGSSDVSARCPGDGEAAFIGRGARRLRVRTTGPWRMVVEQQVETPLAEPPPDGRIVARGTFARIERPTEGEALVYRLAGGRLALRFENFRTAANTDLFVWIRQAGRPRTTRQALRTPHRVLAGLRSTVGDQNYVLPRGTRVADVRSVVIWCVPIRIAYAAVELRRPAGSSRGSATNSS